MRHLQLGVGKTRVCMLQVLSTIIVAKILENFFLVRRYWPKTDVESVKTHLLSKTDHGMYC